MKIKKFTLIELIIVVTIISILASIIVVNVNDLKEKASLSALGLEVRSFEMAVDMYKVKYEGKLPSYDSYEDTCGPTYNMNQIDFDKLSEFIKNKSRFEEKYDFFIKESGEIYYYDKKDTRNPNNANPSTDFSYVTINGYVTIYGYHGTRKDVVIPPTINCNPVKYISGYAFSPKSEVIIDYTTISFNQFLRGSICSNYVDVVNPIIRELNINPYEVRVELLTNQNKVDECKQTIVSENPIICIKIYTFEENCLNYLSISDENYYSYTQHIGAVNQMDTVSIPSTVEGVGDYAFYKANLKDISFGESIRYIGAFSFAGNSFKSEVVIPSGVYFIDNYAFAVTSMPKLTIQEGVTIIKEAAFRDSYIGEKIVFPSTLRFLGECSFERTSLVEVKFNNSPTYIDRRSFHMTYLEKLDLGDNVWTILRESFPVNKLTGHLNIPSSLRALTTEAFYLDFNIDGQNAIEEYLRVGGVSSITLNEGLQAIAFNSLIVGNVSELTIPDSVEYVEVLPILGINVEKIHIGKNANVSRPIAVNVLSKPIEYSIEDENPFVRTDSVGKSLYSKDGLILIDGHYESYNTAEYNRVQFLNSYSLVILSDLISKSKDCSNSINIGVPILNLCEGIERVDVPENIVLPNSTRYIANDVFSYVNIDGLVIPISVEYIEPRAFEGLEGTIYNYSNVSINTSGNNGLTVINCNVNICP